MADYTSEHKVTPYTIRRLTNDDPEFYPIVGPLLSRREVVAALGSPVWDEPGKVWWVAVSGGEAIGMIALSGKLICSFYVPPRTRGLAIGYALLRQLMAEAPSEPLRAVATADSLDLFAALGFVQAGTKGRYINLTIEA